MRIQSCSILITMTPQTTSTNTTMHRTIPPSPLSDPPLPGLIADRGKQRRRTTQNFGNYRTHNISTTLRPSQKTSIHTGAFSLRPGYRRCFQEGMTLNHTVDTSSVKRRGTTDRSPRNVSHMSKATRHSKRVAIRGIYVEPPI